MILIDCDLFGKFVIISRLVIRCNDSNITCITWLILQSICMKLVLSSFLVFVYLINLTSCQNPYRRPGQNASQKQSYISPSSEKSNVSTDAYRVDSKQYDQFFVMRYGLLYQKHSDVPFTGRIVQVNNGNEGKYVSSDENWSNGKKHGQSTKWFSNGTKMYERNYKDGKWHGAVTRWWPNGQRMYVTAYTEGVRNGREAKWKSDGTPLNVSSDGNNDQKETDPVGNTSSQESVSESPPVAFPSVDISPSPVLPVVSEPAPSIESDPDGIPSIPELPGISDSNEVAPSLPELPEPTDTAPSNESSIEELPALPDLPMDPSAESGESLPELPGISDSNEVTPSLPELPGSTVTAPGDELPALPGLPMDPSAESGESLPELPGLPPLPSSNSDSGDLPPLPPLP